MNEAAATGLTLVSRHGCSLCETFEAELHAWLAQRTGFEITRLDVDADTGLSARFAWRVPVLLRGERELCAVHFDPRHLQPDAIEL